MARVRRRWCVVQTPVKRRGTIFPRSATNCCRSRTSRYGIASIFSVQNLQTYLRRKNLPRPPGPPEGRPPGPPAGRPPERGGAPSELAWGADAGAPVSGAFPGFSSDMLFPLHSLCFRRRNGRRKTVFRPKRTTRDIVSRDGDSLKT